MKKSVAYTCRKFDIEKLQTAEAFANRISTLLAENPPLTSDIDLQWHLLSHAMCTAADNVLVDMSRNTEKHLQQKMQPIQIPFLDTQAMREREARSVKLRGKNLTI